MLPVTKQWKINLHAYTLTDGYLPLTLKLDKVFSESNDVLLNWATDNLPKDPGQREGWKTTAKYIIASNNG